MANKKNRAVELKVPYPPTANTYWRRYGHRTLLSKRGKAYKAQVYACVLEQIGRPPRLDYPVTLHLDVCPPDNRVRDLDNLYKPLCDALQHAGVVLNDSLIKSHQSDMGPAMRGGKCHIRLTPIQP